MIASVPHVRAMTRYPLADAGAPGNVSLARNESAFPPSPRALAAAQAALARTASYPDPDWTELRAAIAATHRLEPANILCGAGSTELIGALIHAFAGPGDTVLGSQFGYGFVATACAQAQADYATAGEVMMCVSVANLAHAVTPRTRVVYLCNPGNPSGTLITNAKIGALRQYLPDDVLLIVDQAYGEFADAAQDAAQVFAMTGRGNTVVLRSFSKAYGLAGARVGWGYFPPELTAEIRKLLNPSNISALSQAMAAAAMRDRAHMAAIVARTENLRDGFAADARGLGIEVPPSFANFVLLRFPSVDLARHADRALRQAGLVLRGMGDYGLPEALRATIAAPEVMVRVLEVLAEVMA